LYFYFYFYFHFSFSFSFSFSCFIMIDLWHIFYNAGWDQIDKPWWKDQIWRNWGQYSHESGNLPNFQADDSCLIPGVCILFFSSLFISFRFVSFRFFVFYFCSFLQLVHNSSKIMI
jgi:hypothetical protein